MTRKENLLIEALKIENETRAINGEAIREIDTKSSRFNDEARNSKVQELQERIEAAERNLEQAKAKKAEAKWLATDEGKAYTTRLEQAESNLRNGRDESEKKAIGELNSFIQTQLGSKWGLCSFYDSQMRIGIVDTEKAVKEDGTYSSLFGHDFTIYDEHRFGEDRFEINYGCMGSFSPAADTNRVDFLVGLAKFASLFHLQEEVKRIHREYNSTVATLIEEYKAVKNENPYD